MKRTVSLIMAMAFFLSFTAMHIFPKKTQANAYATAYNTTIYDFKASTYSVLRGSNQSVTFTARINAAHKLTNKVTVYDEDGNKTAILNDDGKSGDKQSRDGIYSATVTLKGDKAGTVNYYAQAGDVKSASHPIKYRNAISDDDLKEAYALWADLEAYEKELAELKLTPCEIAKRVYDYLMQNYGSSIRSINWESEKSFGFTLNSDIENYFEHIPSVDMTAETANTISRAKDLSYISESSIGVWSPYYGIDSNFTESYSDRANAMADTADYDTVDAYYGDAANLESFKKFDDYGIIMIDSHGSDYNGGGYVMIPRPGSYDKEDIADGHLVLSGSTILMRGTFIQKYCDTLPNTIIYIGICSGLASDNFYAPLLNHGASFIAGFDDEVSFTFDGIIMNDFCQRLAETNPSTGFQYTTGEAYADCVALNGDTDTYTSHKARFICYGSPDAVAAAKAVSVESVTLDPEHITLYHLNTYSPKLTVSPTNANRYTVAWSSDKPNIVSVDDRGNLTAYETNGTATITCTVTDNASEAPKTHTASITVAVDGNMPVSGITATQSTVTLYADTGETSRIDAEVLPQNASNRTVLYSSSDESTATVDENGIVTPHSAGTAYITASAKEGGYSMLIRINVKNGDLNSALNRTNGVLEFYTDEARFPMQPATYDGKYCAKSGNSGMYNSTSQISLDAGYLETGSVLCFDWAVSSEAAYDSMKFYVNNVFQTEISGTQLWKSEIFEIKESGEYTFRWAYVKDYSTDIGNDCGYIDGVDIIKPNETHTVKFTDIGGQAIISEQEILHGEAALPPQDTAQEGCQFLGWSEDFTNIRSDMTIYAVYDVGENVCMVTFKGLNDKIIGTRAVIKGNSAEPPTAPYEEGYVFLKWDTELNNITEDLTVYAIYGILGDINRDCKLNTGDATYILRCSAGLNTPDAEQKLLGDFNSDGKINTGDAAMVLKWLVMQY